LCFFDVLYICAYILDFKIHRRSNFATKHVGHIVAIGRCCIVSCEIWTHFFLFVWAPLIKFRISMCFSSLSFSCLFFLIVRLWQVQVAIFCFVASIIVNLLSLDAYIFVFISIQISDYWTELKVNTSYKLLHQRLK
jgi:hypothetical protein